MKNRRPWLRFIEGPNEGTGSAAPPATPADNGDAAGDDAQTPPADGDGDKTDDSDDAGEDPAARGSKQSVLADLAKERDKRQAAESTAAELKARVEEFERAQMSDAEKAEADRKALEEKYAEATAKIAAFEREKTLAEITDEFKIPAAMAGRIQGETPEQMRADAKALATSLGPYTGPPDPSAGQGGGKPAPAASLDAALAAFYNQ